VAHFDRQGFSGGLQSAIVTLPRMTPVGSESGSRPCSRQASRSTVREAWMSSGPR